MIHVVPDTKRYVILRLGRFHRIAGPGLIFLMPILDTIAARYDLASQEVRFPHERGEVLIRYRVLDPKKAFQSISNVDDAIQQSARTAIQSMSGRALTDVFARKALVDKINGIVESFGVMVNELEFK